MTLGRRIEERRKAIGISQAELARRVGIRQSTMNSLIKGDSRSSRSIVQIARELQTTPSYLVGDTNDPDVNAAPPPAPSPPVIMMAVTLPPVPALARMFEGLLAGIDRALPEAERALLLAERLPIGLSQLRDLQPAAVRSPARASREEDLAQPAKPRREPAR